MPSKKNIEETYDDTTHDDEISQKAKNEYINTTFLDNIIKYVKIDDCIRMETAEYKEKVATLKESKAELESTILKYLDEAQENIVNMQGSGKLIKYESIRKGALNKDIIKQSMFERIKKENIITDENKINELVEQTVDMMEGKREIKKKVCLKRTFEKKNKKK